MNKITVVVALIFFAGDFGRHVAKAQNGTLEIVEDFCDNCTITDSELKKHILKSNSIIKVILKTFFLHIFSSLRR